MKLKIVSIDHLIIELQREKEKGATEVSCCGTLFSNNGNTILMTTENQM